ncbi:MAG TPA: N-acetyl-gamma-glutamyl-phosphate reductase [Rhodothermales bacterium]|nr:N-acetyl-gamma-glutamyl-phosphate reductase [Rhodothermales bacterium]
MTPARPFRVAILHGAGYVGGELVRLLVQHPPVRLAAVTSRGLAGEPVWKAHPALRGVTNLTFTAPEELGTDFDVAFVCAEHGQGAVAVGALRDAGFARLIIDLSADHRLTDAAAYATWFGFEHPAPERLAEAIYGLPDIGPERLYGARLIANPGCFATGLALALWPIAQHVADFDAHVTALTGASGSGARPSATTHFPSRDGNVRAYKVLAHQHLPEVQQVLGAGARVRFVPASGPWTRGIWGTAHVALPDGVSAADVDGWYTAAYGARPLVRLSPGVLPELLPVVGTPFADLGWVVKDEHLVVGFALDNLLKGAASQAVHNLNLALGLPETAGLLPF